MVGSVVCGYLLSSPSKGNSVKGSEPFERWLEGPCSFLVWGGVELAEGGGREVRLNRNCRKRQWQATPVLFFFFFFLEEPGRLQSMGSLRVRRNWATSLPLFTFTQWRMQWQPTPVFLPGESQGRQSLVGCRLWGRTESDTSEAT